MDSAANAKMLISSRISGLVSDCTEVRLSLMDMKESIGMLASAAGLDSAADLSASLVEVANLCGRYVHIPHSDL